MATTVLTDVEDLYGDLTGGILSTAILSTGAITPTVTPTPVNSTGYILFINSADPTANELCKFTANASGVLTITAGNRGLGDTTEQSSHAQNSVCIMPYNSVLHEEIDAALAARITASSTDTLTNKTIDVDNNTLSNMLVTGFKSGEVNTTGTLGSAANKLADCATIAAAITASVAGVASVDALTGAVTTSAGEDVVKTIVSNDIEFAVDTGNIILQTRVFN